MDKPHDSPEAPEPLSGASVTVSVSESPEYGDDADTAELLPGRPRQPRGFWTFEFYRAFFDVDTRQVLERIKASVLPVPGKNFVRYRLRNNPDLYGPVWICVTLCLALAVCGDLPQFGSARFGSGSGFRYRPRLHHVPVAVTLVFSSSGLLPLGVWGGSGSSFSLPQTLSAYGYSLAPLVPAAVLWALPVLWLRWAVLAVPPALVLVVTFWPPLRLWGAALGVLHMLLALGCQLYFFEPLSSSPGSGGGLLGVPPSTTSHPSH
ncbi:protein YIPF2 isoform X2 [Sylvia atricapilla]|uniref:protein YIPF2 isoform X2 n=1 Tax=Sylvia atricapilla TaxID=48155 RepID=UPI00339B9CE3